MSPRTHSRWKIWIGILVLSLGAWVAIRSLTPQPELSSERLLAGPHFRGYPVFSPETSNAPDAVLEPGRLLPVEGIVRVLSANQEIAAQQISKIDDRWDDQYATMLVEVARFASPETSTHVLDLLKEKTGHTFDGDFNAWHQWSSAKNYQLHPDYARFKALLYEMIDPRFADFFQETSTPLIRLDEIQWGSVRVDGIPPLKNPKMLNANSADYLGDENVVFGLSINGDERCYPKRILAWHEMFEDTIGGVPICGAY